MPAIGAGEVSAAGMTTSATYAVTSAVAATASQRRLRRYLSYDPYGLMYRKDDPDFAAIVDRTFSGLAQSRDLADLYNARGALVRILSSNDRARTKRWLSCPYSARASLSLRAYFPSFGRMMRK